MTALTPNKGDARYDGQARITKGNKKMSDSKLWFVRFAQWVSHATGRPLAFFLAVATILIWGALGPVFGYSDTWQLVINTGTTIVTFLMVFVIQNTQNRDTAAMHIKIDELIRVTGKARNVLLDLEELDDKTLEMLRLDYEALASKAKSRAKAPGRIRAVPKKPARPRAKGRS
jgi:low affinity Fe/Cu permease